MQTTQNGVTTGYYTPYFIQLAYDIFNPKNVVVPDCIEEKLSLQITGGFPLNYPLAVEKSRLDAKTKIILSEQSTESQNHFCYLWAIWWIHLQINKISLSQVLTTAVDPLVMIKTYGWCILKILNLDEKIFDMGHLEFFNYHFPAIWDNIPSGNKLSRKFGRYLINTDDCEDIDDALRKSISVKPPILVDNSPVPQDLCL